MKSHVSTSLPHPLQAGQYFNCLGTAKRGADSLFSTGRDLPRAALVLHTALKALTLCHAERFVCAVVEPACHLQLCNFLPALPGQHFPVWLAGFFSRYSLRASILKASHLEMLITLILNLTVESVPYHSPSLLCPLPLAVTFGIHC